MLLGTPLRNTLGTWREHGGNKRKKSSSHTKLKSKKNQGTLSACWALSLATWNFYFQNCLSFLAWAKPPLWTGGTYLFGYFSIEFIWVWEASEKLSKKIQLYHSGNIFQFTWMAASCQKAASTALFTVLKVTGDWSYLASPWNLKECWCEFVGGFV